MCWTDATCREVKEVLHTMGLTQLSQIQHEMVENAQWVTVYAGTAWISTPRQ
jgi:hypothetical protein